MSSTDAAGSKRPRDDETAAGNGGEPDAIKGARKDGKGPSTINLAELARGPFRLLNDAVNGKTEVVITCRDDRRLLAKVRLFDKHYNMLLTDVSEMTFKHKGSKGAGAADAQPEVRRFDNLFLRGDNVVHVSAERRQ